MNNRASFFAELKRRNVYKVAVAYAVIGWLLVQIATPGLSVFRDSELGNSSRGSVHCHRISHCAGDRMGL
jgi:hypothetical protein